MIAELNKKDFCSPVFYSLEQSSLKKKNPVFEYSALISQLQTYPSVLCFVTGMLRLPKPPSLLSQLDSQHTRR